MRKEYKLGEFVTIGTPRRPMRAYAPMISELLGSDQPQLLIPCDTKEHAQNTRVAALHAIKRDGFDARIGVLVRGTDAILYKK